MSTLQDKLDEIPSPPPPLSRYDEDSQAEDCVAEVIEAVIEGVNFDISTKSVRLIENGLVAEVALYKLYEIVHLATADHDGNSVPDQTLELLVPDEEPVPAPVDNWARGAGRLCSSSGCIVYFIYVYDFMLYVPYTWEKEGENILLL